MKTSEIRKVLNDFCQRLEEAKQDNAVAYEVREDNNTIKVAKEWLGEPAGCVVKVHKADRDYSFSINDDENLNGSALQPVINAIQDYSMTSIEERKDEKRWYINLIEDADEYLKLYKDPYGGYKDPCYKGRYMRGAKGEWGSCYTKFTRSEIEDWAGTSNSEVIDWIIGKFGEEVE